MDFPFEANLFQQALEEGNIVWRKHTLEKMILRGIGREEVLKVMRNGLLLGFPESRPVHVVASFDERQEIIYIITTYEPDLDVFETDFKTKKK